MSVASRAALIVSTAEARTAKPDKEPEDVPATMAAATARVSNSREIP